VTRSQNAEAVIDVPFPPEKLWPILSKTDWLNRAIGLPPVRYNIIARGEGGSSVTAEANFLGLKMRWIEKPFEWLEPGFYSVRREFLSGPLLHARMGMFFEPLGKSGSRIRSFSEITPRNFPGTMLARYILNPKARRDIIAVVNHAVSYLKNEKSVELPKLPIGELNRPTFDSALERLRRATGESPLAERLAGYLVDAPDVELSSIRPFALARLWDEDRWEMLRLMLHSTRAGLLNFSWEVLCPNCRSTNAETVSNLNQLKREAHCDVCQIRYDSEFDKSVELKFFVHPSIRKVSREIFCLGGPGRRAHIKGQILIPSGATRSWSLPKLDEPHRIRSPQVGEVLAVDHQQIPPENPFEIECCTENFKRDATGKISSDCTINIQNSNPYEVQLLLERTEWDGDILTAASVTNWQEFRDIFGKEVISATEQITIGHQVVLFTDLRGSTAMYRGIGDSLAYALVRQHFEVLIDSVRAEHGAVVKTIGDSVMAVFSRVDEALSAVLRMQKALAGKNKKSPDEGTSHYVRNLQDATRNGRLENAVPNLHLKAGLHSGPCLAVNANDRLDYFGTTINLAARLVGCCRGGDLTISDELYLRPETKTFLAQHQLSASQEGVELRGFDPLKVWRIPFDGVSQAQT